MEFKFFAKDVITGNAKKVGDKFTAQLMGSKGKFVVTQISGIMIFAVLA